jgi:hypothetical protein
MTYEEAYAQAQYVERQYSEGYFGQVRSYSGGYWCVETRDVYAEGDTRDEVAYKASQQAQK